MSPEERELLEKSVSLAEDNNKILRSMHRSMRWASVVRVIYWAFIIGSAIGAFYLLQPYVDEVKNMYQSVSNGFSSFKK